MCSEVSTALVQCHHGGLQLGLELTLLGTTLAGSNAVLLTAAVGLEDEVGMRRGMGERGRGKRDGKKQRQR